MQVKLRFALVSFLALCAALSFLPGWAEDSTQVTPAESFQYNSGGRRDPFLPLVRDGKLVQVTFDASQPTMGSSQPVLPVLGGILWDAGGHSIALIDDTEVQVGQTVRGYRIQEIRQDSVVLLYGGKPVTLRLSFDEPKGGQSLGTPKGGGGS